MPLDPPNSKRPKPKDSLPAPSTSTPSAPSSASKKQSLFERQRAEAEAKRARDQAETAAVYEDFVKSFEDDGYGGGSSGGAPGMGGFPMGPGRLGGNAPGMMGKRHFSGMGGVGKSSGPGSLGPGALSSSMGRSSGPGSLGPPPPSLRKRPFEEGRSQQQRDRVLGFESVSSGPLDAAKAFQTSDDEDEKVGAGEAKAMDKAAAKPTLHLSSLPPGTSPAVIKALVPQVLVVDNVRILPTTGGGAASTERKSSAAIVTLAKETAASDIDTVVNSLQNRYLGWGFYLSISRYLSSAAVGSGLPVSTGLGSTAALPFGARPIPQAGGGGMNRAPPPGIHRGGFAPPTTYTPGLQSRGPAMQVSVGAPMDLKELKLIHKTIESMLTYGPEFEALLMSRPDVQRQEKWAWIWNPRSKGGVYYRWRLWDILTDSKAKTKKTYGRQKPPQIVFEGEASWQPPEKDVPFEYTTRMDELVSDSDYNSSDEESDREDERRRQYNRSGGPPEVDANGDDVVTFLNPLQKAKLTHLLARLPVTNARLRKGDVARVTAFAIEHAGSGADELVEMIVANVLRPFAYTTANPDAKDHDQARAVDAVEENKDDPAIPSPADTSPAQLVGLYLISDILSSSSTSGVRHAWRYRSLFEIALKKHHVFEHLGRMEKRLRWGKLKADKWKRSVKTVLGLWEGWCVFPQAAQEHFNAVFEAPPLTGREKREAEERERLERAGKDGAGSAFGGAKVKNKWKAVEVVDNSRTSPAFGAVVDPDAMDVDNDVVDTVELDGEPMFDDDGDDENLDGEPMADSSDEEEMEENQPQDVDMTPPTHENNDVSTDPKNNTGTAPDPPNEEGTEGLATINPRRQRPRAVDMFADSDDEA